MNEQRIQQGQTWLQQLLSLQGVDTQVSAKFVEDKAGSSCWLVVNDASLSEQQISHLLGERGEVLDSIQYLANTILNLGRSSEEQQAFTVELAGYREKRQAELEVIAEQAAEQVRSTGEEYEVKGLSSAERRQLHHILSAYEGLSTFSRGKEPERHLVVQMAE